MKDYCGHCRRRTEHVKDDEYVLCKRCGKTSKRFNPKEFLGEPYSKKHMRLEERGKDRHPALVHTEPRGL